MTYEYEDFTPLTMERKAFILGHLAQGRKTENWIRISAQELSDFGGEAFFAGCEVRYIDQESWFTTGAAHGWGTGPQKRVRLNVKIIVRGGQPWTPASQYYRTYCTSTTSSNITLTLNSTFVGGQPSKGKTEMQEHHIDRSKLIEVVTENKQQYAEKFGRLKAMYTDEIEAASQRHLAGEIPQNQIMAKDKDGNRIDLPIDMSDSFDQHLKALELDSRDVIILNQEEYYQMVTATSSNLLQVEGLIKKLEELV